MAKQCVNIDEEKGEGGGKQRAHVSAVGRVLRLFLCMLKFRGASAKQVQLPLLAE